MKKSPIDPLLFAARAFLVSAFLVILAVAAVGYCVLPDQIVSRAYPEHEIGLHNPYSKEYFLGIFVGISFFFVFIVFVLSFLPARKRKADQKIGYWDQDENFGLQRKITEFWYTFAMAAMLVQQTCMLIRHFPVNLAVPRRGNAFSVFDILIQQFIILAMFAFIPATLAVVKRYRERKERKNDGSPVDVLPPP